jgi:predicted amidophosphoribosyltransferase
MLNSLLNRTLLSRAFFKLGDGFCPQTCLSCEALGQSPFCLLCENALLHAPAISPQTQKKHLGSFWLYGGPLSLAFGKAKFSKQPHQMQMLLHWLIEKGLTAKQLDRFQQEEFHAIGWVPAHPFRRLQRGFNAANLFAVSLAWQLNIPTASVLQCIRNDAPFSLGSPKAMRQKNIRGRYRALDTANKIKVLLVDDVCTTGATLNEASKQLVQAGATVRTFALAQTPKEI